MDPVPVSIPSFSDVLIMVKEIPNAHNVDRVTAWVKQKYMIEEALEEKVERFEKNLVNRDFELQNLKETVTTLRNQRSRTVTLEARTKEQKKQLEELKKENKQLANDKIKMNRSIQMKEDGISDLLKDYKKTKDELEGKNKSMEELMEKLKILQEQNTFYAVEITKLLDEKEQMLNEEKEEEDDDDDEEPSDLDSDDLESDDEDSLMNRYTDDVTHARAMDELKTQLAQSKNELNDARRERNVAITTLNLKLSIVKQHVMESENAAKLSEVRMKQIESEWAQKLEIEKNEKSQALLRLSEETKKRHEESLKFQKLVGNQHTAYESRIAADKDCFVKKIKEMEEELRLHKGNSNLLKAQEEKIKKLLDVERIQNEKIMVSQEKLVAQMEKNMQLQEEINEINRRVQSLDVQEFSSDDDGHDSEDTVQDDESAEVDYSSDSSFEPVDEKDLL